MCQKELISIAFDAEKSKRACKGMQLLPFDTFYPIKEFLESERFFNVKLKWSKESQLAKIASLFNTSYSFHFHNSMTNDKAQKNLREFQLVTQLAYLQCPVTYQFAPETF